MAPFSRIQRMAALVSRPPEKARPTFCPSGSDCRIFPMSPILMQLWSQCAGVRVTGRLNAQLTTRVASPSTLERRRRRPSVVVGTSTPEEAPMRLFSRLFLLPALLVGPLLPIHASQAEGSIDQINHVIVIYQENWGFDSLYPYFPGADGIANAGDSVKQVEKTGVPYAPLPQPLDNSQ